MKYSILLLRGKIKTVLSRAHVCSLEQRARNAHDQNEQTLTLLIQHFVNLCLIEQEQRSRTLNNNVEQFDRSHNSVILTYSRQP